MKWQKGGRGTRDGKNQPDKKKRKHPGEDCTHEKEDKRRKSLHEKKEGPPEMTGVPRSKRRAVSEQGGTQWTKKAAGRKISSKHEKNKKPGGVRER